jgi:hypothetical protein
MPCAALAWVIRVIAFETISGVRDERLTTRQDEGAERTPIAAERPQLLSVS